MSQEPEASQELTDEVLAIIRRAAFELRVTNPQEAVRVLRRVVVKGGPAAALARGALAEIYFEELADLDGAEAEFRALLKEAPGLPAAELGLARVLRETGRLGEADAGLARALAGLATGLQALRDAHARGETAPEGLGDGTDEELLLLLEVALELGELRSERQGAPAVVIDEGLLSFAEETRLFDQPEDAPDDGAVPDPAPSTERDVPALGAEDPEWSDWTRFYELVARLGAVAGAEAALERLRRAEQRGLLHPSVGARLTSLLLEELERPAEALVEARRHLEAESGAGRLPAEDEILHAAGLLQILGDEPAARALLQTQLGRFEQALAGTLEEPEREQLGETAATLRELLGAERLVGLGRRR